MKTKILLISPFILIFLSITEIVYSAEIAGNAHYYSSNGNSKDSIKAELRQIDLMAAIGEKSVPMGAVKLKLSGDAWVFFELEFEVSPDQIRHFNFFKRKFIRLLGIPNMNTFMSFIDTHVSFHSS